MKKRMIVCMAIFSMGCLSVHAQVDSDVSTAQDQKVIKKTSNEIAPPPPPPPPPPPVLGDEPDFPMVEEMPRFPGCESVVDPKEKADCGKQKMLAFIYDNLVYPEEASAAGVEGMTVVQFVVTEEGKIVDTKLLRDIGFGCGDEAVKVVEKMSHLDANWIPGKGGGRPIKVLYTLPVRFKLPKK